MKGDFSRSTHRAANRYSSVRLQQGRVLLDAEWNEQVDLSLHRERTAVSDIVGVSGVPRHSPDVFQHFAVEATADGRDLRIAPGRLYVDGLLCEHEAPGGTLLSAQPDLPGAFAPPADGPCAVYLDVWERLVTAVDQAPGDFPPLREVALGGPDTAARVQVIWQARVAPIASRTCGVFTPPAPPTGRMRAQAAPGSTAPNDCLVPEGGGYRRLENQCYRVEIHDADGSGDAPRAKWSRDNGSLVSRILAVDQATRTIRVEDPGRDDALGFASARWVEVTDADKVLRNEPGLLLEVQTVLGDEVTVLNPADASLAPGRQPVLRRWDGVVAVVAGAPVELEDGVQVDFDAGTFAPGDYWQVAARTITGTVEWPADDADALAPRFEPRHGPNHHYCVIAVAQVAGGVYSDVADCRPQFPPLADITARDVAYDPADCSNLASARTVQEALDILCKASAGRETGIRIEKVVLMSGRPLENDAVIDPAEFARGFTVVCDKPVFQDSVRNTLGMPNPVCRVTIDLPWPTTSVEAEQWQMATLGSIGFTTVTVAATVNADDNTIVWVPQQGQVIVDVAAWLGSTLLDALTQRTHGVISRVLGRLTLKGNFIWGRQEPDLYLDGNAFGVSARDHTALALPSGDGRRGGDFEMWFWLGKIATPVRPERIGIIPGRASRFFASTLGREAANRGLQRNLRTLVSLLPADYGVDTTQPFDPATAAAMAGRTGVRAITGLTPTRIEKVGTVVSEMLTTNLRIDARTALADDNALLAQVRRAMAAGNPPDYVVGDESLMAKLNDLQFPASGGMIAI